MITTPVTRIVSVSLSVGAYTFAAAELALVVHAGSDGFGGRCKREE